MSETVDIPAPVALPAQRSAFGVFTGLPVWMTVAVGMFIVAGLTGIVLMLVPDLSTLRVPPVARQGFCAAAARGALLGADQLGRAMEYRLLAGLGISLMAAAAVTVMACTLGVAMGLFGGFFGRTADRLVTIVIDVTWAYPTILVAVVIAGIQGPGISSVIWALGLTLWAAMARIVRAQVLALREQDYVLAAHALGYGRFYVATRHLLPNLLPTVILMATLFVALTIVAEAGLSFIGLGAQAPMPSLGKTLAEGFSFASSSSWPLIFSSATIIGLVTVLNAFGDHLRDVLDPKGRIPTLGGLVSTLARRDAAHTADASDSSAPSDAAMIAADGVSVVIGQAKRAGVPVVSNFTVSVASGRTLGIVGESGSGKSVAARTLMGLLPAGLVIASGRVIWRGTDIALLSRENLRRQRGRFVALVFQDARASMDPLYTIGQQISETMLAHFPARPAEVRRRVLDNLARVGLNDPDVFYDRYPHQLSGGQLQRAALAAVLILEPAILIADEPTTGLDATTQKKIMALVKQLQREMAMTVIWISHDLALVSEIADDIFVMYAGEVVERGPVGPVLEAPSHPYTRGLIQSRPNFGMQPKSPLSAIVGYRARAG